MNRYLTDGNLREYYKSVLKKRIDDKQLLDEVEHGVMNYYAEFGFGRREV